MVVDGREEAWSNFGTERDDFLRWMFAGRISGVFFLAGDWHVGVLNKLHRPQDGYPLYELLSSNAAATLPRLMSDATAAESSQKSGAGRNRQSAGPVVRDFNFGAVRFSGAKGRRAVTLQIIDEAGAIRVQQLLTEAELRVAMKP